MSTKITRRHKSSLFLEEISVFDTERESGENATKDDQPKDIFTNKSLHMGDLAPFIRIEEFSFYYTEIQRLEINTSGFLPKVTLTVIDNTGAFGEAYFPKTNPIMSVYIRSRNDKLMPIRNDYIITNIYPLKSGITDESSDNIKTIYTITGELFVPKINAPYYKSIDSSSFEAMSTLSKELQLGFSSNVDTTNDKMIWLNNHSTYLDFLKNEITPHAYINETSFFNSFVDIYYNLNFINLYSMLDEEDDGEDIEHLYMKTVDYLKDDPKQGATYKGPPMLTNWSIVKETSQFINSFIPMTKQGKLLNKEGYRKYIQYYNPLVEKELKDRFLLFYSSPYGIVSPDETKNDNLKQLRNSYRYDYRGIDYGNSHDNYKFAEYIQKTGMVELDKIKIEVELNGINLSIIKNMQIPLLITMEGYDPDYNLKVYNTQENSFYKKIYEEYGLLIDKNYTGKYIVNNIRYVYDPFNNDKYSFKTILTLSKSVWEPSPKLSKLDEAALNLGTGT